MCGIYGIVTRETDEEFIHLTQKLALLSGERGKEAAGLAFCNGDVIKVLKMPKRSKELLVSPIFKRWITEEKQFFGGMGIKIALGHARLVTNGDQEKNVNNHPVIRGDLVGIHNGIVVNETSLWKKTHDQPTLQVDTEAILALVSAYMQKEQSLIEAVRRAIEDIEGSASMALMDLATGAIVVGTNTGSLYVSHTDERIVFASEEYILRRALGTRIDLRQLLPGEVWEVNKGRGKRIKLALEPLPNMVITSVVKKQSLSRLKRHTIDFAKLKKLKRCTRCILPITTPMISLNDSGVCNYCLTHSKIRSQGKKALELAVEPYRRNDGKAEVIVPLSGGRDSSYGLHYLTQELGLKAIAFSYDWGMISDLGRRNQARMVGALGVEHIVVSADIEMKRRHIRKNIEAWIKQPDLGMIPLFMQGDKHCEWYVDSLKQKTGIELIVFSRGNEFERDEFRTGYCGITGNDPGGVIHHLPRLDKWRLLAYYGKQYVTNPSYFNESVWEAVTAYLITYVIPHDYLYLWHFIPWDEKTIVTTLEKEYGWERLPDTPLTWRTDDGSPAFYNYIYLRVQGFTENDSFRSRQIREGVLERREALELVMEENQVRYDALQWYFEAIGIDGNKVLGVIDTMPRFY